MKEPLENSPRSEETLVGLDELPTHPSRDEPQILKEVIERAMAQVGDGLAPQVTPSSVVAIDAMIRSDLAVKADSPGPTSVGFYIHRETGVLHGEGWIVRKAEVDPWLEKLKQKAWELRSLKKRWEERQDERRAGFREALSDTDFSKIPGRVRGELLKALDQAIHERPVTEWELLKERLED